MFLGRGEERGGRVEAGALGSPGEGLVPEHGPARDLDDRLVDGVDAAIEDRLEQLLALRPARGLGIVTTGVARLIDEAAKLRRGSVLGIAQADRDPDREEGSPRR